MEYPEQGRRAANVFRHFPVALFHQGHEPVDIGDDVRAVISLGVLELEHHGAGLVMHERGRDPGLMGGRD